MPEKRRSHRSARPINTGRIHGLKPESATQARPLDGVADDSDLTRAVVWAAIELKDQGLDPRDPAVQAEARRIAEERLGRAA